MTSDPTHRRRRGLVAGGVVAAAPLAVAAVLGWLGRPGGGRSAQDAAPGGSVAATRAAAPGVADSIGGTPVGGFARDEGGAVRAALAYTVAWRHSWLHLGDEGLAAAVAQVAAPAEVDALAAQVVDETRPAREQLAGSTGTGSWADPLAWRVEIYSASEARVAVWVMTTLAGRDLAVPQAEWMTVTVDLAWAEGDWRVAGLANRRGPSPVTSPRDDPWVTGRFLAALEGFRPLAPPTGTPAAPTPRAVQPWWSGTAAGGFGRDERGAVAAALAYSAASQRWLYFGEREVAEAVAQIAAPRSVDALVAEVVQETATAQDQLAKSEGPVWWWVDPLAWRAETYSDARASVAVWAVTVLSAQAVAVPQSEWMTVTVDLEWVEGDWRVTAIGDRPGPTPIASPRDEPWDAVPFAEALQGFTRVGEEPAP
jgi:hypothetical protein